MAATWAGDSLHSTIITTTPLPLPFCLKAFNASNQPLSMATAQGVCTQLGVRDESTAYTAVMNPRTGTLTAFVWSLE